MGQDEAVGGPGFSGGGTTCIRQLELLQFLLPLSCSHLLPDHHWPLPAGAGRRRRSPAGLCAAKHAGRHPASSGVAHTGADAVSCRGGACVCCHRPAGEAFYLCALLNGKLAAIHLIRQAILLYCTSSMPRTPAFHPMQRAAAAAGRGQRGALIVAVPSWPGHAAQAVPLPVRISQRIKGGYRPVEGSRRRLDCVYCAAAASTVRTVLPLWNPRLPAL